MKLTHYYWITDLTDHNGERKDAHEVVDELETDLEHGGGVRQSSDSDQGLHSKVITADVPADNTGKSTG